MAYMKRQPNVPVSLPGQRPAPCNWPLGRPTLADDFRTFLSGCIPDSVIPLGCVPNEI
jgi:hypothetical protein